MKLLITNDDGIQAPGLHALVKAGLSAGHQVFVSAPNKQQSANSQRITISTPIMVFDYNELPGAIAYAVDGTPADCVRIASQLFEETFDFCISGINNGDNAGCAVHYSGTVGAAKEAAMKYIPSLAVSIKIPSTEEMLTNLAKKAVRIAEYFQNIPLPRLTVLNLNAPALPQEELKPLVLCETDDGYYKEAYERRISPRGKKYFWISAGVNMETPKPNTDCDLLNKGHMTLTLLSDYADANQSIAEHMPKLL